jgi:hypothetical protein
LLKSVEHFGKSIFLWKTFFPERK